MWFIYIKEDNRMLMATGHQHIYMLGYKKYVMKNKITLLNSILVLPSVMGGSLTEKSKLIQLK